MNQSNSNLFFQCDASTNLTDFVQFCFKSICTTHQQNDECLECDPNTEIQLLSLLHELTGIDGTNVSNINTCCFNQFINSTLSCYSSNDRLYLIKSLSIIIQHTHIQSSVHQIIIQLLSQIMSSNANWCSRLSDDIKLINFIIKHIMDSTQNVMIHEYEVLLQFISKNIAIRKIPQIKGLLTKLIDYIIDDDKCNEYILPKLIIVYNITESKDASSIQRYIKSLSNLKKLYKKLSRLMSNQNMWIVLYSLFILTKLVINDPLQSQLFNRNNINIVFQLIFNLILHGASADIKMLEISVNLLLSMLSNHELIEFLCDYPKLEKTIEKLLPLLLVFPSHSLFVLKLLNILMQNNKMQSIIIPLFNYNRYLSVILRLCLYYDDFNISIQAIKCITATVKSQHFSDNGTIFVCNSHHYPRHAIKNNSQEFIAEIRRMCFVEDASNTLFGHTQINGNNIMKKLCFAGHIQDYSLLTQSQKYIMYFIELFNLICRESNQFKSRLVQLINIQDLSYFLCPSKSGCNGEPNQIFLSIINLICSLNQEIVGIGYLLKTSLCDSLLISAISNSFNSKSNSKDISNAIEFIHYIFNILSKEQQYDGNSTFIQNLLQNNNENDTSKRKKRKPRHYERNGLTLSNDTMSTQSTECISIADNNVQNMSSKILYQLFCKKMVRFNKTHKSNDSKLAKEQFESLKIKYSKTVKSLETKLKNADAEMDRMKTKLSNKTNDFAALQQEFDALNSHFMVVQDDNQTKKHIIKDKTEKLQRMKTDYNELHKNYEYKNNELRRESNELKSHIDEIMNKLKCVCSGYNKMKQESKSKIDQMDQELKCEQQKVIALTGQNSELTHKCNQSNKEITSLHRKLSETQKLAEMIQNLMSNNNQ